MLTCAVDDEITRHPHDYHSVRCSHGSERRMCVVSPKEEHEVIEDIKNFIATVGTLFAAKIRRRREGERYS